MMSHRFVDCLVNSFIVTILLIVGAVVNTSAQQSTLSTTAKTVSATAIPGEWVHVVFETTGNAGAVSFLPYWHPKGVTLFTARPVLIDSRTVHLGSFHVDSALTPGDHDVEFLIVDEVGQSVQTAVTLRIGPGFPRDLDKIADKLSVDVVAITHANHDEDGKFQAIAHYKSTKSLRAIANIYRAWLNENGWEESLEVRDPDQKYGTVSTFHGFLQAKKAGELFQLQLDVDAITEEHKVKVTFDFR